MFHQHQPDRRSTVCTICGRHPQPLAFRLAERRRAMARLALLERIEAMRMLGIPASAITEARIIDQRDGLFVV